MNINNYIAEIISKKVNLPVQNILTDLTDPPSPELGDLTFKSFVCAKKIKINPVEFAEDLSIKLQNYKEFTVNNKGPYVNFKMKNEFVAQFILNRILDDNNNWGQSDQGKNKTVIIDFSSPNIAKPFGVGHLRSTAIGAALYRIYNSLGYKVIGINHLGDWGTNFGFILTGFEEEGYDYSILENDSIRSTYDLYVKTHKKSEKDTSILDRARKWFKRLENDEKEAVDIWMFFKNSSIEQFKNIYDRIGIKFDFYTGESFYKDKTEDTIKFLKDKNLTELDEGALIVRLDDLSLPPVLLKKTDKSTLYATREIAAILYRIKTYAPDLLLYVVGNPQELHFRQIKCLLQKAGLDIENKMIHVRFGHILGMSTRKGTLIFLEDLIDEAVSRAKMKIKKNKTVRDYEENIDDISEAVGIGALLFNDLKNKRIKDIEFNWERALSFEGETGPYLQYAHARMCSIIRKASVEPELTPEIYNQLNTYEDKKLLLILDKYPKAVQSAAKEFEPSILSKYLLELASVFSNYYHSHQVLTENKILTKARLSLLEASRITLAKGLNLLGIEPLSQM